MHKLENIVLGCLCSGPIIRLLYADVQKRPFVKVALRLEWAFGAERYATAAKYRSVGFHISRTKAALRR
jgi:hypothetical protein